MKFGGTRSQRAGAAALLAALTLTLGAISSTALDGPAAQARKAVQVSNPILFVTQVPLPTGDAFASRASTFANHLGNMDSEPRGGDLMVRYPDGTLRNLTRDAGYGDAGVQQGANRRAPIGPRGR